MKVLEYNNIFLRFCGILSKDENPKPIEKAWKYFINLIGVIGHLYCCVYAGAMYIYHNLNNFSGVVNAVMFVFGGLCMFGSYLGFISNESKIRILQHKLQTLVNDGKLNIESTFHVE